MPDSLVQRFRRGRGHRRQAFLGFWVAKATIPNAGSSAAPSAMVCLVHQHWPLGAPRSRPQSSIVGPKGGQYNALQVLDRLNLLRPFFIQRVFHINNLHVMTRKLWIPPARAWSSGLSEPPIDDK